MSVVTQKQQISGPPKYFTIDWKAAEASVKQLRDLNPLLLLPGHGKPMKGEELVKELDFLATHFKEMAKPEKGRFVEE